MVGVINNLLDGVRRGPVVSVRECVVDYLPDDLDGVGGGVLLTEALVFFEPVRICYDGVRCVQVGYKIQCAGSTVTQVWPI